jgi:hypothetical protein
VVGGFVLQQPLHQPGRCRPYRQGLLDAGLGIGAEKGLAGRRIVLQLGGAAAGDPVRGRQQRLAIIEVHRAATHPHVELPAKVLVGCRVRGLAHPQMTMRPQFGLEPRHAFPGRRRQR